MKTYTLIKENDQERVNNLWESFIEYLNQVYFEGAVEILDSKTVSFEYQQYAEMVG
jgi:hypothetical protein